MPRTQIEVFLSSTAMDLEKHRNAVYEGLRRTGIFHCIRQEDFGPRDAGAVAFCRQKSQSADLFVGLVGSRRGWEPDGDNAQRSITEMEHDWAREAGRRRFIWVTPDDFPVASHLRESDVLHARQEIFRKRIMDASEHTISQKAFGSSEQLALEIVSHLLAEVVASELIKLVRPDLMPQEQTPQKEQAPQKEQVPALAAAVEKLADDKEINLLALARNPEGADVAELQAKLTARAEAHEAAGERERKSSAEYWRHAGALAYLHDTQAALRAYAKATELDPDEVEAWNKLGHLQRRVGELDAAICSYERVLALGSRRADQVIIAVATGNLGMVYRSRGDLDTAEAMITKALAVEEALGRKEGMANAYGNLGLIHQTRGDLDAAEAMHKKSLAIEETLGRKDGMASDYGNLGLIYQARGDLDAAEVMHKKSLAIREALSRKDGMASDYGNLGLIYQTRGDLDAAEAMHKKSLAIHEALDRKEGMARQYSNLGLIYRKRGDLDEAETMHRKALAINESLGRKEGMARNYGNLGNVYQALGDLDQACSHWRRALGLFSEIGAKPQMEFITAWLRDAGCPEA